MDLNEQLQNNTFFLQNNEAINSVLQISNLNGISNSEIEQNFLSPNLNCQTFPQTTTFFVKQIEESYPSEAIQCEGCGMEILERHLFCLSKNNEHLIENEKNNQKEKSFWHENCLRCVKCNKNVGNDNTRCFVHDGRIFCSEDYSMLFGPTAHAPCTRCGQSIPPTELVYRSAGIYVYHLHCFVCFCCGQQLRLGEEYINVEGQLICQREVNLWRLQQPQIPTNFLQIPPFPELEFNLQSQGYSRRRHRDRSKKIPKRPRTILNAPQRKAFKYAFEKGQKPTRKAREQLARETGLSVRVVQVWFQNQRFVASIFKN
uniref:Homeobox domain-containing protein n=1 Tax=Meloidogyne hapla TaxID=6305 RepID=A0A1I8BLR6_MELHA